MRAARIASLALALLLALMPLGQAEETYDLLTLSNFQYELGTGKPVDVDATVRVGYGGALLGGSARLDLSVTGDGRTAFDGTASVDDGKLRAALDKSKYRFEIPLKDLQSLFFSRSPYSTLYSLTYMLPYGGYYDFYDFMNAYSYGDEASDEDSGAADFKKLSDLIVRYTDFYRKALDPDFVKAQNRSFYETLKPEAKGLETVDVFGQTRSLYRYEYAFRGEDLRRYYEITFQANPELVAMNQELMALLEDFDPYGDEEKEDKEDKDADGAKPVAASDELIDIMMDESGLDGISCVVWSDTETISDEASKVSKWVLNLHIKDAVDEYGMPIEFSVPISFASLETDKGRRERLDVQAAPYEGETVEASYSGLLDIPRQDGGFTSIVSAALAVSSATDGIELDADLNANVRVDADGVGDVDVGVSGASNGQDFSLRFACDGKTSTPAEKSGTISFSYNLPSGVGRFEFDTLLESSPYAPADYAAYQALQPVNPLKASRNVMDKVESDLYGALMQGMGALMQTKGLSQIIGGLMNAA